VVLNLEILRKRWEEIERNLVHLELAAALAPDDFISIPDKAEATMFRLVVSIEAAQAICSHLAVRVSSKTPNNPSECFACLAQGGLYEPELAAHLSAMSRFRNLLVHRYWNVEPLQVHGFLASGVADLRAYVKATTKFVGSR
jgi:uncharacterized protein YutE (UPF0331/DUF86 family)